MTKHSRNSDPDSSDDGIPSNITEQALKVLKAYRNGDALLDSEAYRRVGLGVNRLANQRCSDLRAAGFIVRTGEKALTPYDNLAYLCCITKIGRAYLERNDDD